MKSSRTAEIWTLAVIALLVAVGGKGVLFTLSQHRLPGAIIAAGIVLVALNALRSSYNVSDPDLRLNVTKSGAYFCAAVLALWAVLGPAKWVFGACIVAAEAALVFDIISLAARRRAIGGSS